MITFKRFNKTFLGSLSFISSEYTSSVQKNNVEQHNIQSTRLPYEHGAKFSKLFEIMEFFYLSFIYFWLEHSFTKFLLVTTLYGLVPLATLCHPVWDDPK